MPISSEEAAALEETKAAISKVHESLFQQLRTWHRGDAEVRRQMGATDTEKWLTWNVEQAQKKIDKLNRDFERKFPDEASYTFDD